MDVWQGFEHRPATLHKYAYVHVDPVNNIDPSGYISIGSVGASLSTMGSLTVRAVTVTARSALSSARAIANTMRFFAGRPPATRWGFWGDLPKVTKAGREYAQIRGRLYTREAVNRMTPSGYGSAAGGQAARGIPPMAVEEVIRFGTVSTSVRNGVVRNVYTLGELRVVTEGAGNVVITVIKVGL
jgi:hypothetical protein